MSSKIIALLRDITEKLSAALKRRLFHIGTEIDKEMRRALIRTWFNDLAHVR